MTWDIVGFDNSYKRPVFAASIVYASGPSGQPGGLNVLLCGMKLAAGTLVPDVEIRQVFSRDDCNVAGGVGSQIALMGISAFKAIAKYGGNVNIFLCSPVEATGTVGTVTVVYTNAPATVGQVTISIRGVNITQTIQATDTIASFGANFAARINAIPDLPFLATFSIATLTLTSLQKGAQNQAYIVYHDASLISTGMTATVTGAATVNTVGGLVGVTVGATGTGTGVESVTNILTKLASKRWARIGVGQIDATNIALWKTFNTNQAAVTTQLYNQAIFAAVTTQAAATTLSQTTLNDPRSQLLAYRNSETHPSEMVAGMAAVRAAIEGLDIGTPGIGPVPDYDRYDMSAWIVPQRVPSDVWLPAEENALLNAGATPITTANSQAQNVRAITTYCLLNAVQDERCLDIGDAVFPDYMVLDLQAIYQTDFRPANPIVQDDPGPNDPTPASGVGFPRLWTGRMQRRFEDYYKAGCIQQTFRLPGASYPLNSTFNKQARRIQSNAPFVVNRVQHSLSVIARQSAPV